MTQARLVLDVMVDDVDIMSGVLWSLGTTGIEEAVTEETGTSEVDGTRRLYAGFDSVADAEAALTEIGRGDVVPVTGDEWLDSWRDHARVEHAGEHFVIKPAWLEHDAAPDDVVIDLDPGRSFGSGSHPTTRLALAAVERVVTGGTRVLDVGCGSGVLGIGAALIGAAHVTSLDPDPEAVLATTLNAERNGLGEIVDVGQGSIDIDERGVHDVVVANILAVVLVELAPQLVASCAEGGTIVVSGFLDHQADRVMTELAPFTEMQRDTEDSWVASTLRRTTSL